MSKNTVLTRLYCNDNRLKSLDVSNNALLANLACRSNQLTNLVMGNNTLLTNLDCRNNQLTNLDVSHNTSLYHLNCANNRFTTFELNALFKTLRLLDDWIYGMIFIGGNPGTYHCDRNIAWEKGWEFYDTN